MLGFKKYFENKNTRNPQSIITDSFMKDGVFHLHMEVERKPHHCPSCNTLTNQIHDYRLQKIQHTNIFSRESILFYRKRRYVCGC